MDDHDSYEARRKAFEKEGMLNREAHQSREQLKTLAILFAMWAVGAAVLYWLFG